MHPLDNVQERRFGIVLYALVERAVIPAPVLCELVELERRLGEGREHRPVPARVVDHEGLPAATPLQLGFLAAPEVLISVGIDRKQHPHAPRVGAEHDQIAVLGRPGVHFRPVAEQILAVGAEPHLHWRIRSAAAGGRGCSRRGQGME